ncbi:hypothetical protein, partial [Aeromonas caviae]|uniref:hypothetical protein n=1 Tax=Aeromonas caviae TaxID=648 RepID=UPI004039B976
IQPLIGNLPNIMAPEWFDGLKRAAEGRRLMVLDTLRHGAAGVLFFDVEPAQRVQHHQAAALGGALEAVEPL